MDISRHDRYLAASDNPLEIRYHAPSGLGKEIPRALQLDALLCSSRLPVCTFTVNTTRENAAFSR